jgi:uncharacterized protein (DUF1800 family)
VTAPGFPPCPIEPSQALEAYDGPWTPVHAQHLLRRALGGFSRGEVQQFTQLSPQAALDVLFQPPPEGDASGWNAVGQTLARSGDRVQLAGWWLMRLVRDRSAVGSRLALFLHGHFACTLSKTQDLYALLEQHQLFVSQGSGPFGELLRQVLRGPAMLRFLDGDRNRRGIPNENLARELLELFTLGVGHYTEQDVKQAARALTGWTVRDGVFAFVREHHDPDPKHVLGREIEDGDDLCRVAAEHPRCARFLVEKVWHAYVSPDPRADVLDEAAANWRERGLELGDLLRTLLGSRAFFAAESLRSLVRSPVELVAGTLRACGATPDLVAAARACDGMGQKLFEPPGVQGWGGGSAWIHAAAWIARTRFASRLARSIHKDRLDSLFSDEPEGLLSWLRNDPDAGPLGDAASALEVIGLGDLVPQHAATLAGRLPADLTGAERRRDLLFAALCLPEAHLS